MCDCTTVDSALSIWSYGGRGNMQAPHVVCVLGGTATGGMGGTKHEMIDLIGRERSEDVCVIIVL